MFLVSSCSCLCPIHLCQVLSREWEVIGAASYHPQTPTTRMFVQQRIHGNTTKKGKNTSTFCITGPLRWKSSVEKWLPFTKRQYCGIYIVILFPQLFVVTVTHTINHIATSCMISSQSFPSHLAYLPKCKNLPRPACDCRWLNHIPSIL